MKLSILITVALAALFADESRAGMYCSGNSNLEEGVYYKPGTFFTYGIECTTDNLSGRVNYQYAPPYSAFWDKPIAWKVLWPDEFNTIGTQQVWVDCQGSGTCTPPFVSQSSFTPLVAPCEGIDRRTLGKNIKAKMGPTSPNRTTRAYNLESCARAPIMDPIGNSLNTPREGNTCSASRGSENKGIVAGDREGGGPGIVAGDGVHSGRSLSVPTSVAYPVNVATGSVWHEQTDFVVPGRTPQSRLEITRTYTANAAVQAGGFGPNWRHNYEMLLQQRPIPGDPHFDYIWIDSSGGPHFFRRQEDGSYLTPPGSQLTFTEHLDHFELRKADHTVILFIKSASQATFGKPYRITESHGESVNLTYDSQGQLVTVSSPFAGSITFSYNDLNLITEIHRDRDNLSYFYTYAPNHRLTSATDFQNRSYTFTYVSTGLDTFAEGMLESITDPAGREIRFTYDNNGRAKQQFVPGGGVWTFAYGDRETIVTAPNGSVSRYFFNETYQEVKCALPDGSKHYRTWENGLVTSQRMEFGGTTEYGYDANGNVSSTKRPEDPSPTLITYDQNFNKPTLVQPIVGAQTQFTLNSETGDVTQMSRGGLSLSFTHDSFGNLLSTNNGRTTYANQRNANGQLTYVFDLHNPETRTYDARGRLATRSLLSGRTFSYSYNDYDSVLLVTDSHGPTVTNIYDVMERLVQRTVSAGGIDQVTTFQYDDKDRLVSTKDPLNRVTAFFYDNVKVREKPSSIIDPAGRTTHFEDDSMDRLIKKTDAIGAITKFTYDQRGNLTSVTDANGNVTRYAYDLNDRKIREDRPSVAGTTAVRRVQEFFYDPADRLVREITRSATGGANRALNYEYDPLDRLIRKIVQREGSTNVVEDDSIFSYESQIDATLITTANNGVAQLNFTNEAAPPFVETGFSLAATESGNPFGLIEGSFSVTTDVTGGIASVSKDEASLLTKAYDAAGRLIGVNAGSFSTTIGYDSFGRKQSVGHSTGETGTFLYDLLNRVTAASWSTPVGSITEALAYDTAGNITSIARENGAYTVAYDAIDQIVSGAGLESRSWTYDSLGNRLQDSLNGSGIFLSNFLVSNGTSSFLADSDGFGDRVRETTGSQVKNYTYRNDGKIGGFQLGNLSVDYFYDGLERLVAKAVNDNGNQYTQTFAHLGRENRVLLGKAGDGSITTFLEDQGIAEHLGEVKSGVGKGYVTDHLGSVLNGETAGATHSFGLFGEVLGIPPAISASSSPIMYGWQGLAYDGVSGQWDNYARQYNQNSATFNRQDPSGIGGGFNFYGSRKNNPLRHVDYTGRRPAPPEGGGGYSCQEVAQQQYNRCMAGMAAMYVSETGAATGCLAAGPGAAACVGAVTTCAGAQAAVGAASCSVVQQQAFNSCQAERNNEQTHETQFGLPNLFDVILN